MLHIIDVVRGTETDRLKSRGHHRLPTFGKGADYSKIFWEILARQLISSGNINIDIERFGALKITKRGWDILYGRENFTYKELILPSSLPKKQKAKKAVLEKQKPTDPSLLSKLKNLRLQLARKKDVPAFIVFSDRTLIEMTNLKPQNLEEMSYVNGVGKQKLELYGEAFLQIIKN